MRAYVRLGVKPAKCGTNSAAGMVLRSSHPLYLLADDELARALIKARRDRDVTVRLVEPYQREFERLWRDYA